MTNKKRKITGYVTDASIQNDVGGTSQLPTGKYRVQVHKSWHDYEIGTRCIGELLDESDIKVARIAGTTGRTPDDYRKYGEDLYRETLKQFENFNPRVVYFAAFHFVADARATQNLNSPTDLSGSHAN